MSHTITSVGTSSTGSRKARAGSGKRSMSLSWIFWKPRMLDPSKPIPSENTDSVSSLTGTLKCCHVPGRSVKRRSTIFTPSSLARWMTSLGLGAETAVGDMGSTSAVYLAATDSSIAMRCLLRWSAVTTRGRWITGVAGIVEVQASLVMGASAMDSASENSTLWLGRSAQTKPPIRLGHDCDSGGRLDLGHLAARAVLV